MNAATRPDVFTEIMNDVQIPCEKRMMPHCGNSNPAEWVAWTACTCPDSPPYYLWCTPCKNQMLAALGVRCGFCNRVWPSAGEAFRLIEPLWNKAA